MSSTDLDVTKSLVETLEDGEKGFESAAAKLADSDSPEVAALFTNFSSQRAAFAAELRNLAASYGDDGSESSSVAGAVHRGWIAVKDALTGSDPHAVINAAVTGERHAVGQYEEALGSDISAGLRNVLERQLSDVRAACDTVAGLADRTA